MTEQYPANRDDNEFDVHTLVYLLEQVLIRLDEVLAELRKEKTPK